ncbi:hypothetical protein ACFO3U_13245 [Flavobacterium ponti]|uniref:Uncharacterized protein n=1 Tax=Flavobacterium ponti TaxID=665133 RepID=A0ABV9PA75_9FLAO
MNEITILQKIALCGFNLMVSTFTSDLLINAKQVNYFEMFLLSFAIEFKNMIIPADFSFLEWIDIEKINMLKMSLKEISFINS